MKTFFFIIALFLISYINTDDNQCSNASPKQLSDCTQIQVSDGKKCCFVSDSDSSNNTISKCAPISYKSYNKMESEIDKIKNESYPYTVDVDCNFRFNTKCNAVINPAEEIVCHGRSMESGYQCCYIEADDKQTCHSRSLQDYPKESDFTNYIKNKFNYTKISKTDCSSSYLKYVFVSVYLLLLI